MINIGIDWSQTHHEVCFLNKVGGCLEPTEALRALADTALSMGTDASFTPATIKATIKSGFVAGLRQPRGAPDGD